MKNTKLKVFNYFCIATILSMTLIKADLKAQIITEIDTSDIYIIRIVSTKKEGYSIQNFCSFNYFDFFNEKKFLSTDDLVCYLYSKGATYLHFPSLLPNDAYAEIRDGDIHTIIPDSSKMIIAWDLAEMRKKDKIISFTIKGKYKERVVLCVNKVRACLWVSDFVDYAYDTQSNHSRIPIDPSCYQHDYIYILKEVLELKDVD